MQCDQKSEPDGEHDKGNQKVAVMQNGPQFFEFSHCIGGWTIGWRPP